jgi:hypothetical protein
MTHKIGPAGPWSGRRSSFRLLVHSVTSRPKSNFVKNVMCADLKLYYRVGSSAGMFDWKRVGSSTSCTIGRPMNKRARSASADVVKGYSMVVSLFATKLQDKIGETDSSTVSSIALIAPTVP